MDSVKDLFKKCSPWMRLSICINIHVKKGLIDVLHNHIRNRQVQGLTSDPAGLYAFLQTNKSKIQKSTVIKEHQKSILLPVSSQTVDSSSFDISLTRFLIQTFCGITNARGDWREPDTTDQTICAYVYRAASMRNSICHDNNIERMNATEFERKWKQLKEILQGLKYVEDIEPFKTETLDLEKHEQVILEDNDKRGCEMIFLKFRDHRIKRFYLPWTVSTCIFLSCRSARQKLHVETVDKKEFVDHLRNYKEECSKEKSQNDYILRRFHVHRNENNTESDSESKNKDNDEKDIITESDLETLIKENDRIMIYGEAGLGKTSMAKRVKNELCKEEILKGHHLIYYDSKRMNKLLTVKSFAAPLYFSELWDYFRKKGRTVDDLSIYKCVKTTIDELIIIIDGIDEFPVRKLVNRNSIDELEKKIKDNEEITATETIFAIYFGFFFPYSKVVLLGRIGEFDLLKKVHVARNAGIFNRRNVDLELLKFDDANIKDLTCLKICKQPSRQTVCIGPCHEIYNKIKNIELCKNPTDLNSLIELHKKHPNKNIGNITRTKLIVATLFNRLTNHIKQKNNFTIKSFDEISENNEFSKYLECFRILGEVSFKSLLKENITVQVKRNRDINGIVYFEDENRISIERETLEELDFFYVRDFDYYFILEPYHTLNIEFLSACYLFSHADEWDLILKLNKDRQLVIISFIAGLYADNYFTIDFVENVLSTSSYSLEPFFSWLYDVENVRESLPNGDGSYSRWFGLMETQKLSPSFYLLDSISLEVEIPQTFIPKTIVCYCYGHSYSSSEWYDMDYLKYNFLTKLSDKLNIESFLKKFPDFKFIIKDNIKIKNNDDFNRFDQCGANNLITFRINLLLINASLDTSFSSNFNLNTIYIRVFCLRTIDMILNALSPPSINTSSSNIQPALKCKQLVIRNISSHFNPQQTEKLFELCLCGVVDYIRLRITFFTDGQLAILKDMERKTHKLINIDLNREKFDCMFGLPNVGNRHLSLRNVYNVTDNDLIKLRNHISPGYSDNLANYEIISPSVPFVRKDNSSTDCKQTMYLNFDYFNFAQVSTEVFANTFSIIPSLSCVDDDRIPSSHWLRLSQTDDCQLNEMRIWKPQPENLEYFLNMRKSLLQFVCGSKAELRGLLNHIVTNKNVQFDKQIKVFVVKIDVNDWDYYEEIPVFTGKTIEEYKDDCSSDNLHLDNIRLPFYEGEQHLKWWCCEISLPFQEKTELCVTNTYNSSESATDETEDESPIVKKLKMNRALFE